MWLLKVILVCAGVMDKKGEKCEEKDQSLGPFLLLSVWNLILFFFLPIFMYAWECVSIWRVEKAHEILYVHCYTLLSTDNKVWWFLGLKWLFVTLTYICRWILLQREKKFTTSNQCYLCLCYKSSNVSLFFYVNIVCLSFRLVPRWPSHFCGLMQFSPWKLKAPIRRFSPHSNFANCIPAPN